MRRKIVRFPVLFALFVGAPLMAVSLFFLIAVGVLVGLFVEMFKLHSRISNRELREYKISKPIEKDNLVRKANKIFKLPLPDKFRSKGVFMSPMNENKLSKVR